MQFEYVHTAQAFPNEIFSQEEKIKKYATRLREAQRSKKYTFEETVINLPKDKDQIQKSIDLAKHLASPRLKYIIDIGIGGSNLGTKAIYDALYGQYDLIEPLRYPKMLFADTDDPRFLAKIRYFLKTHIYFPDEVLITIVTKSGTTTETIFNAEAILAEFAYKNRIVLITEKNNALDEHAKNNDLHMLGIPKKVGGRFSVFSPVGLFPLACAGVNIEALLIGARKAIAYGTQQDFKKNHPAQAATALFVNYIKGKLIHDTFLFAPELESLGKWYRQLMSECVGKEGKGITPTVSIGSTDLHSMAQLYLGGIKDKYFNFVSVKKYEENVLLGSKMQIGTLPNLKNRSAKEVIDAILQGTKTAFKTTGLPFCETFFEKINEEELGEFMQFKMIEIMYLGALMEVNTFDQPEVEKYKAETRKILNS